MVSTDPVQAYSANSTDFWEFWQVNVIVGLYANLTIICSPIAVT